MPDFTTSDGLRLFHTDTGTGVPILCLSGLTRNSTDFDYVAPHLGDARMIALDYRGRGRSDWADAESYTVETEARDVLELLDHLGLERVAILGTSRGGLIAMALSRIAHPRLLGVMLNDIGPEIAPGGMDAIRAYVGRRPNARTLSEAAMARADLIPGFDDVPHARWEEEAARHYVETTDGLDLTYDPNLARAIAAGDGPMPDSWPGFDAIAPLPLAAVRGANSNILTRETFEAMRARRPDMIAAEIPGRGHVPFLDEPDALAVLDAWKSCLRQEYFPT